MPFTTPFQRWFHRRMLRGLVPKVTLGTSSPQRAAPAGRRCRPELEVLEGRIVPAFNLTISNNPSVGVVLNGGAFTAAASGANVNVGEIQFLLFLGNVSISNGTTGGEAGNITWVAGANLNYGGPARNLTITAETSSTNGAITLQGQVNTTTALNQAYNARGDIVVNAALNGGAGTILFVTITGTVTQNSAGKITAANIGVSALNAVTLDQANDVTTGVLAAEVLGAGQSFTFNDANDLTVGTILNVPGVTTNDGPITVRTTAGSLAVNEDIDAGAAAVTLRAGGGESILVNNALVTNSGGNTIDIAANRMALNSTPGTSAITAADGGRVKLHTTLANRPVDLSGSTDPTSVLTLSDAELDTVTTSGVLQIGDGIEGNVTLDGAISPNNVSTLTIDVAGSVAGGGAITVSNLRLSADAGVNLPGGNSVGTLAGAAANSGADFIFNNAVALIIGTVDGVAGVTTNNGNIEITAPASITLDRGLQATGAGDITLTTNELIVAATATISASDGIANGNNVVTIRNFTAGQAINLGSNITLGLTDAELDRIQAEILRIGRNDVAASGAITISDSINLSAGAFTTATLHLLTGAGVVDGTAGEQTDLIVAALGIQAVTGIGSADDLNVAVSFLAATSTGLSAAGGIRTTNTTALTIANVDGVAGVLRTGGSPGDIVVTAPTTLTVNAAITNTTGGEITLTADDFAIAAAASIETNNRVTIRNFTPGRPINLGANTTLGLTDAELDRIGAAALIVGRNDASAAGTITVSASINLGSGAHAISTLQLLTGADVVQSGSGTLTVATLGVQAGAGVGADLAPLRTVVGLFAASAVSGGVFLLNQGPLTIGTIAGVVGVTATGDITLTAQESTPAGDHLTVLAGATITSSAGAVLLQAGDTLSLPNGAVVNAAGAVTLVGGFSDNGDGGAVSFFGTATGASVTVQGGAGNDTFVINPVSTAATLPVQGLGGSDTFIVTPKAATTINVTGGLPTPPALPGDVLSVEIAGTTNPALNDTSTPTGFQGNYTFGNRMPVNFQEIETLTTAADLLVTKSGTPSPVITGQQIAYTLTLSNIGEVAAANVELTDAVPANTTFVSFTQTSGPAFTLTPPPGATGSVTANIASLGAGQSATFSLVVQTDAGLANNTPIVNTASAATDSTESSTANNAATETIRVGPAPFIAVGAETGDRPRVAVFTRTGALVVSFLAYPARFRGGVRVAVGDVNGDGTADIITVGGPGVQKRLQIIDGTKLNQIPFGGLVPASVLLGSFLAFPRRFDGGIFVATGYVNGDGKADIIVSAGAGKPRVRVFDGASFGLLGNFLVYPGTFLNGVTVAAGDVNGDGRADVITGPARGVQRVKVIDGTKLSLSGQIPGSALLANFFPYPTGFGGAFVAAGDVNGDDRADIIIAPAAGAPPLLKVVDATRMHLIAANGRILDSALLANQLVFARSFRAGVQVGALELDLDGLSEILVGTGPRKRTLLGLDVLKQAIELNLALPFDVQSIAGV